MNFLKRAWLSSKARLGKTAILFAVMLTVCVVVLASIGIKSATEEASILARQKLGAEVSLQVDMKKVMETMKAEAQSGERFDKSAMAIVPIPLTYVEELSESEYVSHYSLSVTQTANGNNFLAVGEEDISTDDTTSSSVPSRGPVMPTGDVTLEGVNDLSSSQDYLDGYIELVDGRLLTEDDINQQVVVIEQTLADENELVIGDMFEIYTTEDETVVSLEIVGIYETSAPYNEMASVVASLSPYNKVYTPYTVTAGLKGEDYVDSVDKVVFHLTDPIHTGDFIEFGESTSIDFEVFSLDQQNGSYEAMMGPIENVASFSQTTLILVVVFGGLILTLIIMLSIKDRMNEIGILLSLGEDKSKVVLQLLTEVLIVLVLALGVSFFVGDSISQVISDQLIANELAVSQEQTMTGMNGMGGRPSMGGSMGLTPEVDAIDELNINISAAQFMQLGVIGVLVSMIATIFPALFIMRLHPKTILSQHS